MSLEEFIAADTPLIRGTTLIEASAGTGKTYTIAALFLRLIIEQDLRVSQILVTTYTVPATAELRDRIRRLLHAALVAWTSGFTEDPLLNALLQADRTPAEVVRRRVGAALRAFDEAAIYTIHGFCQRILQDRAFESSALFDVELITDESALFQEVAQDYWRLLFYAAPPHEVIAAGAAKLQPAALAKLLKETSSHSRLRVLPSELDLSETKAALASSLAEFRTKWPSWREQVRGFFLPTAPWAKGPCNKSEEMKSKLDAVERCFTEDPSAPDFTESFKTFRTSAIAKSTSARGTTPAHPFFDLCDRILELTNRFGIALETNFLAWARAELLRRKLQQNVVSFDDLLTRLHAALQAPGGTNLAAAVRTRFPAALIDEFQDTDPIQEEIFTRVFASSENWLYLIGDPKQAIYGFRGADVFSYLAAAARADHQFKLGTNFRSVPPLVAAVNTLFSRPAKPFLADGIEFDPVRAAPKTDAEKLRVNGEKRAPFRIWLHDSDEPLGASSSAEQLPRVVAAKISRLLDGRAELNGRGLQPSDIAVLTASNKQARAVQAALSAQAVPSVLLSNASVFDSREAADLQTLLAAIAEPLREGLLRGALAGRLLGQTAAEIDALSADEGAWEKWLLRFQTWNERWRCEGFIPMFRRVLIDCCIRPRLLGQPDGERALTNILHLGEVLHHAACEQRLSPTALALWLAARRREKTVASEEHEVRLERDEDAVRVVTVHKSKGLEYNVVFCPFGWGKAELWRDERPLFHSESGLTLDFGSDDYAAHEAAAEAERLAEHLRLLYVALTRARHECHFAWGRFGKNEVCAAMWLLHPPKVGADPVTALQENCAALTPAKLRAEIQALAENSPEEIAAVLPWPEEGAPRYRSADIVSKTPRARTFRGKIERDWRVSSFTSLTRQRDSESPDHDPTPATESGTESSAARIGIHAFPAGMTPGVCLHTIFEKLDFTKPPLVETTVKQKLNAFGFDAEEWTPSISKGVRDVLDTELAPGLQLARVPMSARLVETEFHLSAGRLTSAGLGALIQDQQLAFDPRRGLLKGFIDLIFEHGGQFFIVDWKSNRLGREASDYHAGALAQEMARHHYGLQYHLYTLALHRYLRLRLAAAYDYERHFGGVFYVFLRGVDPARPELGIFRDRPPRERIAELDAIFSPTR
ncbi:MAG TPA: exodeoxyribonuclease V subunit beta [Chthoniobacteraceae bacterium]|jgi:exodeoxyribonuclease V beta subunit